MEQMKKMDSCRVELTDCLDPDEKFIGFSLHDDMLDTLTNKKRLINIEVSKKRGEPMEEDDYLSDCPLPIVNNNHVKNKKSKSSLSSPETHSRSASKKMKKETLQSETIESSDVNTNAEQSLEFTTPTFNLTSSNKSRRTIGRKINVDISDPIYKLPFELGWKRELVYRTTSDNTAISRTNRNGDVYYYSPNNRKLRSLREIQEQLDLSLIDDGLTIDSFTFLKQPIGIDDRSKELIRDANTKLAKDEFFVGTATKPKKSTKTPVRHQPLDNEFSDNENKSSQKMKIVFKNVQKKTKSKSKKDKGNSEAMNLNTTPEYITEDWQAIQSSVVALKTPPSKVDEVEINTANKKIRSAEMNGSLKETRSSMASMQSFNYMMKAMRHVFMHLKMHELLSASRVCTAWNMIAMNKLLWQTVRLKNSLVHDWEKCFDSIYDQSTVSLDTRRMLIPAPYGDYEQFWLFFVKALTKAKKLKVIELYRCPTYVVEEVLNELPQLEILNATSIKNPNITKEVKNVTDYMALGLSGLVNMAHLTEIRLKGLSGMKLTSISSFENLVSLKTLSLTSVKAFPKDICRNLETITTNLEYLEIGECECLSKDFATVLKRLTNLKSLRLENCCGRWDSFAQDVFCAIRSLEKLTILELINIEFSSCVENELEKCVGIKSLLIIPAYVSQSATTNCHLIECLKKLGTSLTHLIWGLTYELLRVTDLFISQYQQNQQSINYKLDVSTNEASNNIPILRTRKPKQRPVEGPVTEVDKDKSENVDILSVPALETLLVQSLKKAKTKVIKVPFSATTRVYLSEHFNDL